MTTFYIVRTKDYNDSYNQEIDYEELGAAFADGRCYTDRHQAELCAMYLNAQEIEELIDMGHRYSYTPGIPVVNNAFRKWYITKFTFDNYYTDGEVADKYHNAKNYVEVVRKRLGD